MALPELQDDLTRVQSDLGKLKDDAKDEYVTEIDAVEQASASVGYRALKTSDAAAATLSRTVVAESFSLK